MFNEYNSAARESWTYKYKASELNEAAKKNRDMFTALESAAKEILAEIEKDKSIPPGDPQVVQLKYAVHEYGKQREICCVLMHEFSRDLEREYELQLGDVVYFGLAEGTKPFRFDTAVPRHATPQVM